MYANDRMWIKFVYKMLIVVLTASCLPYEQKAALRRKPEKLLFDLKAHKLPVEKQDYALAPNADQQVAKILRTKKRKYRVRDHSDGDDDSSDGGETNNDDISAFLHSTKGIAIVSGTALGVAAIVIIIIMCVCCKNNDRKCCGDCGSCHPCSCCKCRRTNKTDGDYGQVIIDSVEEVGYGLEDV